MKAAKGKGKVCVCLCSKMTDDRNLSQKSEQSARRRAYGGTPANRTGLLDVFVSTGWHFSMHHIGDEPNGSGPPEVRLRPGHMQLSGGDASLATTREGHYHTTRISQATQGLTQCWQDPEGWMRDVSLQQLKDGRGIPNGLLPTTGEESYESETRVMPDVATRSIPRMSAHREPVKIMSLTQFCT